MQFDDANLFIKILIWAYSKHPVNFSVGELKSELNISDELYKGWVTKVFFNGTNDNPPLIIQINYNEDGNFHEYSLSPSGIAMAIDYIELSEARKSSIIATRYAIAAIFISILLGAISIVIGLMQIYLTQDVSVVNFLGVN